uniref:FLYWCH-type domain-containing protein n=1 Tax=Heterorhabditis bacteriophora TaxID=37862 RepID=A0A1I7X585_HETBA
MSDPVSLIEYQKIIDGNNIGYCKYGNGPNYLLCICGAVGITTNSVHSDGMVRRSKNCHTCNWTRKSRYCNYIHFSHLLNVNAKHVTGMKNTDHWLPSSRAPYLAHYPENFLRTQWAALCDVVQQ